MEQKLTFTAYLQDQYSKKFDKLAATSDENIKKIARDLDKLSTTGKKAARSIDEIDKRLEVLGRAKRITIDTKAIKFANQEIKNLEREKAKLEGGSSGGGGMFGGMGKGFAVAGGILAAGVAAQRGISASIEASMEREQQKISFEVLAGSKQKGNALLDDIIKMGAETPFESNDLIKATQTMMGFGIEGNKVLPIMKQLGDISGGNNDRFQSLALAYSQMSSTGHLMGQDLLQMINAGFNPLNQISKDTGKSMAQLKKEMEAGGISAKMVTDAIAHATGVGGKYFGMMDKQSQTAAGRISTLKDNAHELAVVLGDHFKGVLNDVIGGLSTMVMTVKSWFALAPSEKTREQATSLRVLKAQLDDTNTSEKDRLAILKKIKDEYGDYLGKLDLEKDSYEKISAAIENVITMLDKKAFKQSIQETVEKSTKNFTNAISDQTETKAGLYQLGVKLSPSIMSMQGITMDKRLELLYGVAMHKTSKDIDAGSVFMQGYKQLYQKNNPAVSQAQAELKSTTEMASKMLKDAGLKDGDETTNTTGGGKGKGKGGDGAGTTGGGNSKSDQSISGGSKITHLNITIGSLVNGGVSIHSSTVKEGASKMKDIVTETLLTAVNDANLAANNN